MLQRGALGLDIGQQLVERVDKRLHPFFQKRVRHPVHIDLNARQFLHRGVGLVQVVLDRLRGDAVITDRVQRLRRDGVHRIHAD